MKKIVLNGSIILMSVLIFSCSKQDETVIEQKPTQSFVKFNKEKLLSLLHKNTNGRSFTDDETFLANLDANLDSIGAWHDEFLTYMFHETNQNNLTMCDKPGYLNYNTWGTYFFDQKGIEFTDDFIEFYENNIHGKVLYPHTALSDEGNDILETLGEYIEESDSVDLEVFLANCNNLKTYTLGVLEDDLEKTQVGVAISIAKYSAMYWDQYFAEWDAYYSGMECSPNYEGKISPKEKKILQADAAGAINGAIGGGLGAGPVGAVAGALVVGGWGSCVAGISIGFGIDHITDWFW